MGPVALRKESVDRNCTKAKDKSHRKSVALRKESVDRNIEFRKLLHPSCTVALRKESVDRNTMQTKMPIGCACRSPQGERG